MRLEGDPLIARKLNAGRGAAENLDEASYVAMAGRLGDGIFEAIERELLRTFQGRATPHLLHALRDVVRRPQDMVAYAYLFKHLEFGSPFESRKYPFTFADTDVAAFGIPWGAEPPRALLEQVIIHDYRSRDDFVIELTHKSEGDRLILAKVAPSGTLESTVRAVDGRVARAYWMARRVARLRPATRITACTREGRTLGSSSRSRSSSVTAS